MPPLFPSPGTPFGPGRLAGANAQREHAEMPLEREHALSALPPLH